MAHSREQALSCETTPQASDCTGVVQARADALQAEQAHKETQISTLQQAMRQKMSSYSNQPLKPGRRQQHLRLLRSALCAGR